jgi:mono/diheme cytochrome c family protein
MHRQIAIQQQSVLWHNSAKGECMNMILPLVNRIKYHPSLSVRGLTPAAIVAVLLLAVPTARTQNAAQKGEKSEAVPAGNAETGKKIFIKAGCYECHGREGQGAAQASGPRIGPSQRFIRPFIKYVRQPTGQMPPYTSAVISDQELADIYAYLQSRPMATPSKDIPLLNQ